MQREKFKGFPPQALRFFSDLKRHNNRPWFQARKDIYEKAVKEPMVEMILSVGEALRRFAPEMVADSALTGAMNITAATSRRSMNRDAIACV